MKTTRTVTVLTVFVPSADRLIDMLRYDQCIPRTEHDAAKIVRLIELTEADAYNPAVVGSYERAYDHIIELTRFSVDEHPANAERWASFGCKILDERHPDATPHDIEVLRLLSVQPVSDLHHHHYNASVRR